MDGVILDSEQLVVKSWQKTADKYGIEDIESFCMAALGLNREAAKKLYIDEIDDLQGFIPTSIDVGGIKLGPADFLFAMLDALCGINEITVTPREQNISLHEFPDLANPPILNWPIRYPGYTGEYLIRRLPLQAWTIRF